MDKIQHKAISPEDYRKISIHSFAKQVNVNIITSIANFITSNSEYKAKKPAFDFDFPYIIEGILIFFCTKGKAKVRVNLFDYSVQKGSLLLVAPNSMLQPLAQSDDFRIEFLFFTFDFISSIQLTPEHGGIAKKIEAQPLLLPDEKTFNELLLTHQLIVSQCLSLNSYREEAVKSHLNGMIFQILQFYTKEFHEQKSIGLSRQDIIYRRFISLLFENYKKERSIQFYAEKLNLTPKYFSKIVKQANKLAATERIDEIVIMAAKALLKSSELTVAQISEELNFANPSFFGTYFRKKAGMSPAQYRKNG